jgi:tRNA G10  N-methylase Trm11
VSFLYLLSYLDEEREVAEAELWALTCGAPDRSDGTRGERLVRLPVEADVTRAAHVSLCAEEVASAEDLQALCDQVAARDLRAERFRVRAVKVPGQTALLKGRSHVAEGTELPARPAVAKSLADVIDGSVDLTSPLSEFVCFVRPGDFRFGRLRSQADRGWVGHQAKPHSYSSSLPARLARAMVNIGATPGQWVIDPCCGAGTLLLEAESVGIHAAGCDANKKLTSQARDNLRHFGLPARVFAGDARTAAGEFDAVVTDLPYGWTSKRAEGLYGDILANAARLAPRLCIVLGDDFGSTIERAGYEVLLHATQRKQRGTRHVFLAVSRSQTRA